MATPSKVLSTAFPKPILNKADFDTIKILGSGRFATVFKVREIESSEIFAIKTLSKVKIVESNLEKQVDLEIQIHSSLDHKNIVKFYSLFRDEEKVFIVLEYISGKTLLEEKAIYFNYCFPNGVAAKCLYQIADALIYIHEMNIFHGDLKPANILLDRKGDIKVADFGFSGWTTDTEFIKNRGICGTSTHVAPEQILMAIFEPFDERIDIWALGVIAYELLKGLCPFRGTNAGDILKKALQGNIDYDNLNAEATDLISQLLKYNPDDRITLREVQRHPFIFYNYSCDNQ